MPSWYASDTIEKALKRQRRDLQQHASSISDLMLPDPVTMHITYSSVTPATVFAYVVSSSSTRRPTGLHRSDQRSSTQAASVIGNLKQLRSERSISAYVEARKPGGWNATHLPGNTSIAIILRKRTCARARKTTRSASHTSCYGSECIASMASGWVWAVLVLLKPGIRVCGCHGKLPQRSERNKTILSATCDLTHLHVAGYRLQALLGAQEAKSHELQPCYCLHQHKHSTSSCMSGHHASCAQLGQGDVRGRWCGAHCTAPWHLQAYRLAHQAQQLDVCRHTLAVTEQLQLAAAVQASCASITTSM